MARHLAARGDSVALAARSTRRLEEVAAAIPAPPGKVSIHTLDVNHHAQVERVIREADMQHAGLDVVVVNAGLGGGGRIGTGRFDDNLRVVETNLVGALAQIESAMEIFRARDRGHLVLVSSLASLRGLPSSAAVYSASKAALAFLGESLRTEMAGSGVAVTVLRPGYIRTELSKRARVPFMTPLDRGVEAMIAAMDRKADDAVVPAWPWKPLGWALRVMPPGLLRRFM